MKNKISSETSPEVKYEQECKVQNEAQLTFEDASDYLFKSTI